MVSQRLTAKIETSLYHMCSTKDCSFIDRCTGEMAVLEHEDRPWDYCQSTLYFLDFYLLGTLTKDKANCQLSYFTWGQPDRTLFSSFKFISNSVTLCLRIFQELLRSTLSWQQNKNLPVTGLHYHSSFILFLLQFFPGEILSIINDRRRKLCEEESKILSSVMTAR